jgi:hypothetical protein
MLGDARAARWKHGHKTPLEKSKPQGAGATLLHFTNPSLAPHFLSPSPPNQISAHSVYKITSYAANTHCSNKTNEPECCQ